MKSVSALCACGFFTAALHCMAVATQPSLTDGNYLLVADWLNDKILRFDAETGDYVDDFVPSNLGGLNNPSGMAVGSDGHLYVASSGQDQILRFDGQDGSFLGAFATQVGNPIGITFGPDGNLYVASRDENAILRIDGDSGAIIDTFATADSSVLWWPWDLGFNDGSLLVSSFERQRVLRFDGVTGDFVGTFANSGTDLERAAGFTCGPDGNLYLATFYGGVRRFDGSTGGFLDIFASYPDLELNSNVAFGPDGNLYVASESTDKIFRFDGTTGEYLGEFSSGGTWYGADFLLFTQPVPEPTTLSLLSLGSLVLVMRWRLR